MPPPNALIAIVGPTASGKTALAAHLAHRMGGEVISADSRQLYRGMDLGTGKDYHDYVVAGARIPYHLIDVAQAGEQLSVFHYHELFQLSLQQVWARGRLPILCGGSGLYIEAALRGYQLIAVPVNAPLREQLAALGQEELEAMLASYKKLHNHTDTSSRKRLIRAIEIEEYYSRHGGGRAQGPTPRSLVFGVCYPRDMQRQRITQRLTQRLEQGLVDEVRGLLDSGIPPERLLYYGLEYKWITQYLLGAMPYEAMFSGLNTAIHQLAKRQMTWFRRMERAGIPIRWVDHTLDLADRVAWIAERMAWE